MGRRRRQRAAGVLLNVRMRARRRPQVLAIICSMKTCYNVQPLEAAVKLKSDMLKQVNPRSKVVRLSGGSWPAKIHQLHAPQYSLSLERGEETDALSMHVLCYGT